jgi:hypothetical protein
MASVAALPVLAISNEAADLAARLVEAGILPRKAFVDALHVAAAAVHGMDFLLTWNCTHIANARVRANVEERCRSLGLQPPIICTPEELQT